MEVKDIMQLPAQAAVVVVAAQAMRLVVRERQTRDLQVDLVIAQLQWVAVEVAVQAQLVALEQARLLVGMAVLEFQTALAVQQCFMQAVAVVAAFLLAVLAATVAVVILEVSVAP